MNLGINKCQKEALIIVHCNCYSTDLELADLKRWHQTSPFFPAIMNSQPTSWPSRPSASAVSIPRSRHTFLIRRRRDSCSWQSDRSRGPRKIRDSYGKRGSKVEVGRRRFLENFDSTISTKNGHRFIYILLETLTLRRLESEIRKIPL